MSQIEIEPFNPSALEFIARIIGERYKGWQLANFFSKAGFPRYSHDGSSTKWVFVYDVLQEIQGGDNGPFNVTKIIEQLCDPQEYFGNSAEYEKVLRQVNEALGFYGLAVKESGKIVATDKVDTILRSPTKKPTSRRQRTVKPKISILLVFSNPRGTDPLRLATEERVIRESIALSRYRDNITLTTCPAATIHDLSRALLNGTFHVIQISGHGSGNGLILEDELGGQYLVHQPTLAELFHEYSSSIQCVILNACYSIGQGDLISFGVPFTIAMEGSINDKAAIEFSRGFYDALGAGKPIDHAYREGCRRIKFALPRISRLPFLLGQGETSTPENMEKEREVSGATIERIYFKEGKALVGFAIDLSGSMVESIRNETGGHLSRLESVRQSIGELIKEARESIRESRARHIRTSIDMFIYGFGLRTMSVCDLLSLVRASRQVITKDVAEEITQRLKQEKQEKYKGYEGTSDLVRQLGLSGAASYFEDFTKRHIQALVRKRIWHEVKAPVEEQLTRIGDTTLPIEEIVQLWEDSEDVLTNAEELLFGNTPVKELLAEAAERFRRELRLRDKDTQLVLFIVSDGKYANIDPLPMAVQLRDLGVTIVSCFVTDKDSAIPRALLNRPAPEWEQGAKLLFEMASMMEDSSEVKKFLLHKGWVVYPGAKLFVQLNHSDILKEFARVILSLLEEPADVQALPKGW